MVMNDYKELKPVCQSIIPAVVGVFRILQGIKSAKYSQKMCRHNQYFLDIEVSLVPRPLNMDKNCLKNYKNHVLMGLGTSESLIMKKIYFERSRIIIPRSKMGSYTLSTSFVISQWRKTSK